MMKNEQMIAVAIISVALIATFFFMKNSADPTKKEGNNSACKRTGMVASQAEITGLQI
jgi:competence protein ComGC